MPKVRRSNQHGVEPRLHDLLDVVPRRQVGAHVFCEKPLGTTRDEAMRMVEAAGKASRIGAVGYCYRGYSVIRELRLAIESGFLAICAVSAASIYIR